ncbi:MAG: hypothetical protein GYB53_04405 [Rhodobacteraceae bacterium]|nr:hypothetical protein [Paracoccaceae bacterium]
MTYPDYETIKSTMFDPDQLRANFELLVDERYQATEAQVETALALRNERARLYPWTSQRAEDLPRLVETLRKHRPEYPPEDARIWCKPLILYGEGARLCHVDWTEKIPDATPETALRVVLTAREVQVLDGKSLPIHRLNETELSGFSATGAREEYISFFCNHVFGDDGGFHTLEYGVEEELPEGPILTALDEELRLRPSNAPAKEQPYRFAFPITRITGEGQEAPLHLATVAYGNQIFRSCFEVDEGGTINMKEDAHLPSLCLRPLAHFWQPKA